jgi:hypothetical protein
VGRIAGVLLHGTRSYSRHVVRASCRVMLHGRFVRHVATTAACPPWCDDRVMAPIARNCPRSSQIVPSEPRLQWMPSQQASPTRPLLACLGLHQCIRRKHSSNNFSPPCISVVVHLNRNGNAPELRPLLQHLPVEPLDQCRRRRAGKIPLFKRSNCHWSGRRLVPPDWLPVRAPYDPDAIPRPCSLMSRIHRSDTTRQTQPTTTDPPRGVMAAIQVGNG